MKKLEQITKEDLLQVLQNDIPDGWEIYNYHICKYWRGIKIRKKYDENQLWLNEDGYEYKQLFLQPSITYQYKILLKLGYSNV